MNIVCQLTNINIHMLKVKQCGSTELELKAKFIDHLLALKLNRSGSKIIPQLRLLPSSAVKSYDIACMTRQEAKAFTPLMICKPALEL